MYLPVESPTGDYYRRRVARSQSFPLNEREQVEVQYAWCPEYIGVMVADQFGTLERESIIKHLTQDYQKSQYVPPSEPGGGLGLYRINRSSAAMLFLTRPGKRTEAMIFIGNEKNMRNFRLGFSFLSTMTEK